MATGILWNTFGVSIDHIYLYNKYNTKNNINVSYKF